MSVDGGQTYPYDLSPSSIPNNGSYEVTMPNIVTSSARIKVSSVGNVYYAVNSQDFSVTIDDIVLTVDELDYGVCQGDSVVSNIIYETNTKYTDTATFVAENVPEGMTVTFDPPTATEHNTPVTATFTSADSLPAETYPIDVVAISPERSQRLTYQIQNYSREEFEEVNLNGPKISQLSIDCLQHWNGHLSRMQLATPLKSQVMRHLLIYCLPAMLMVRRLRLEV